MYTDANWAGNRKTRRSIIGYIAHLNGTAISWAFKRQISIAQFSYEAEYIATSEAVKEAI